MIDLGRRQFISGKAFNIEYGNIEKKGNIESMLTKIKN